MYNPNALPGLELMPQPPGWTNGIPINAQYMQTHPAGGGLVATGGISPKWPAGPYAWQHAPLGAGPHLVKGTPGYYSTVAASTLITYVTTAGAVWAASKILKLHLAPAHVWQAALIIYLLRVGADMTLGGVIAKILKTGAEGAAEAGVAGGRIQR